MVVGRHMIESPWIEYNDTCERSPGTGTSADDWIIFVGQGAGKQMSGDGYAGRKPD
jgi:hypothetical protein